MSRHSGKAPSKRPFVLLGMMTVLAFGGPFVIALVLRGGRAQAWPPDRPVEWLTFGLICGAVIGLMIQCVWIGFIVKREAANPPPDGDGLQPPAVGRDAPAEGPEGDREEGR